MVVEKDEPAENTEMPRPPPVAASAASAENPQQEQECVSWRRPPAGARGHPSVCAWTPTSKSKAAPVAASAVKVRTVDGDEGGRDNDAGDTEVLVRQSELAARDMTEDPAAWLGRELERNDVTGLLFYRGRWWIMWPDYLREFGRLRANAVAASSSSTLEGKTVRLYAICSESQAEASKALVEWNLAPNFDAVVGDGSNVFTTHTKEAYLPRLFITDCSRKFTAAGLDPELSPSRYPCGAVQPGLLFFAGSRPAIGWAVVPSAANLGGSLGRPQPGEVWKVVERRVAEPAAEEGGGGEGAAETTFEMVDGGTLPMTVSYGQACANCCCVIM